MSKVIIKSINFLRNTVEYFLILLSSIIFFFSSSDWVFFNCVADCWNCSRCCYFTRCKRFETPSIDHSGQINDLDYRIPAITACLYITSVIIIYQFYTYELPIIHYVIILDRM